MLGAKGGPSIGGLPSPFLTCKSKGIKRLKVTPLDGIFCGEMLANPMILKNRGWGGVLPDSIIFPKWEKSRDVLRRVCQGSPEPQIPPLGLPPRQAQRRRLSGAPVSPRSG